MNFRSWLEAAIMMSPWEAVGELGLESKVGEPMTEDLLRSAYNKIALETHPDRNPDPSAAAKFKRAADAHQVLRQFIGGKVPGEYEPSKSEPQPEYGRSRSEFYREISRRMAPIEQYSMQEFQEWVSQVVEKQFFQFKDRQPVGYVTWGMKLSKDGPTMPMGSVISTKRITGYARKGTGVQKSPRDSVIEVFGEELSRMPKFIVDMKAERGQAWVTLELPDGGYHTFSFFPVEKREKKAAGVGMKKDEVIQHLLSSGLRLAGSYTAGDNYGVDDSPIGYFVQLGSKVIRIIRRYRGDYYGKKTIETENRASEHYGKMTKELLDKYVAIVKRRSQQPS